VSDPTEGPYRIAIVCLGNICRSPMADVVLRERLGDAGLSARVRIDSFGTGGWHRGNPMDRRAAATLTAAGYDASTHRARQITASALGGFDLVLAMDGDNLDDLQRMSRATSATGDTDAAAAPADIRLFRDFDLTNSGADVPDPYYGGADGFEEVLEMVERTVTEIVARLRDGRLGRRG
jgi:protein-tyrosine phosphatase